MPLSRSQKLQQRRKIRRMSRWRDEENNIPPNSRPKNRTTRKRKGLGYQSSNSEGVQDDSSLMSMLQNFLPFSKPQATGKPPETGKPQATGKPEATERRTGEIGKRTSSTRSSAYISRPSSKSSKSSTPSIWRSVSSALGFSDTDSTSNK